MPGTALGPFLRRTPAVQLPPRQHSPRLTRSALARCSTAASRDRWLALRSCLTTTGRPSSGRRSQRPLTSRGTRLRARLEHLLDVAAALAVPYPHRPIVAGAGEMAPVARERHPEHRALLGVQHGRRRGRGAPVPYPHRPIEAGAGEMAPVIRERHPEHRALLGVQHGRRRGRGAPVPYPHRPIVAGAGEMAPVIRERHPVHRVLLGVQHGRRRGRGAPVPYPHRRIVAGAGEMAPVIRDRHPVHRALLGVQHGRRRALSLP